tara:strand:+ start:132 stop:635 length:504 start_codon:yes stop_codon:yes gene_type:complete
MQLNQLIIFLFIGINGIVIGQNEPDTNVIQLDDIEISIISNYYQQDGSHSPVTGGVGTEKLSNIAPVVYVKLPLDSARTLNISAGFDYYSSASSDNIDNPYLSDNHVSGASASDIRHYYSLAYQKKTSLKGIVIVLVYRFLQNTTYPQYQAVIHSKDKVRISNAIFF